VVDAIERHAYDFGQGLKLKSESSVKLEIPPYVTLESEIRLGPGNRHSDPGRPMKSTKRRFAVGVLLLIATAVACSTVQAQTSPVPVINPPVAAGTAASEARLAVAYGKLPLSFEANHGQTDGRVKFLSRGSGYALFLTSDEAVLALKRGNPKRKQPVAVPPAAGKHDSSEPTDFLRMRLLGASPAVQVSGMDELLGKSNYFIGHDPAKWQANVPTYAKVKYNEVYPGVNLIYYGNQRQLEYDFVVAPGADPQEIRLNFRGAKKLRIDEQGALVLETQRGEVRFDRAEVYQKIESKRRAIAGKYVLRGRSTVGFEVGSYDRARPLVIDPVLVYSTYLGGSGYDQGNGIAVDSAGNVYVTGFTNSSNFPTVNALQPSLVAGGGNAFIAKINASGSTLVYSTYLGGSGTGGDEGYGIAVDSAGDAYVTGSTTSSNFPTVNPLQAYGGNGNAFVAKLNSTGSALVYSTYLGGSNGDQGNGIAVDSSGNAYVTGSTESSNFPTVNALQPSLGGSNGNAFIAKINASGSALVYSTYLGGSGMYGDAGHGIAVDLSGDAYVTGYTSSSNFPMVNALQPSLGGSNGNAFITKINASGSALVYSTYLGGSGFPSTPGAGVGPSYGDAGHGIAVDSSSNAYVTGYTDSSNFPTVNPIQPSLGDPVSGNAFISKINASGSALVYSTFYGSGRFPGGGEQGNGIAVDPSGNAYVTGYTYSFNFPTVNALQLNCADGGQSAFILMINASGSTVVYSTCLGAAGPFNYGFGDAGNGIAVDSAGNAYVTGDTSSTNFPTVNALQPSNGGIDVSGGELVPFDAFVAKIVSTVSLSPQILVFVTQPNGTPVGTTTPVQTIALTNNSNATLVISNLALSGTNASDFAETDNCVGSLLVGASCNINVTFTPMATGTRTGTLTITNNLTGSPLTALVSGTGITPTLIASLSPSSLTFTNQMVGLTSAAQGITFGNIGNAPLIISNLAISGTNASEFAVSDNCGPSVAAGASCTINVTFAPAATGTRTGTLSITDNATSPTSPQTVTLTGTGIPSAPVVSLSSTSVVFANQSIGSTSAAQTVTLSNTGAAILNIQSVALAGAIPGNFAIASGTTCTNGATVAANGACVIQMTFTPTGLATVSAIVGITDNAADSPEMIGLSGTAIPTPLISLTPSSITFSAQYVGTSGLPQSVTVTNSGNASLSITSVTASPSDFAMLNACGSNLAAGASCAIGVFFDPTAGGTRPGTLTINDNAPGSPQTVALTGNGEDFSISPSSSSSATVSPGQTANYSLAVAPAGGFNQSVSLTCVGAPAQSTCAVSPNTISLGGTSAITAMVTVSTTGASQGWVLPIGTGGPRSMKDGPTPMILVVLGTLVLVAVSLVPRRLEQRFRWVPIFGLAVLVCLGMTMSSCGGGSGGNGGGGGNIGTQAGTYTITVSGTFTSGATTLTNATKLTLVVQ